MILSTQFGDFPIPDDVDAKLPSVPDLPDPADPDYRRRLEGFNRWLEESPGHLIDFERLKRWRLVQGDAIRAALDAGRPVVITADGLE